MEFRRVLFRSPSEPTLEEVHVWGQARSSHEAGYTTPTSVLLPEDMHSINATTTEDLVKYEPSLVIRRRFIGDANGTMGMRGSNMFQTRSEEHTSELQSRGHLVFRLLLEKNNVSL